MSLGHTSSAASPPIRPTTTSRPPVKDERDFAEAPNLTPCPGEAALLETTDFDKQRDMLANYIERSQARLFSRGQFFGSSLNIASSVVGPSPLLAGMLSMVTPPV